MTMHSTSILLTAVSLLFAPTLAASSPTNSAQDARVVVGVRDSLYSDILGEQRRLLVHVPEARSAEQRFPVLVLMDGRSNFKHVVGTMDALSRGGTIPPTIVVGIENTDRWRDLTPQAVEGFTTSGGSRDFLGFIEAELLPHLDATYPTSGFRILSGHSLGGLTALQAVLETPDLFQAVIALTPSLEWAEGELLESLIRKLAKRKRQTCHLYLAIADETQERPYFDHLVAALDQHTPEGMHVDVGIFDEWDDHSSIRVTGGLAGLRSVYRDWRLTSSQILHMSPEQVEAFVKAGSAKYGEDRSLTIMDITNAGYGGIYDPQTVDRALALFQEAIDRWPGDGYALSCMGEGLERTGDLEGALEYMERAWAIVKDVAGEDHDYYRSLMTRVRKKLDE